MHTRRCYSLQDNQRKRKSTGFNPGSLSKRSRQELQNKKNRKNEEALNFQNWWRNQKVTDHIVGAGRYECAHWTIAV
ncbi:hypothetical protein TNCV_1648941 [Trichonephila clavipes]|uniref:Uncharacterized protein n=1 Tax=Trichonephila clavipes TaxID=2585209 RepID=A0A8X6RQF3_TRICX|nr:hypothetical protein TNCV_1648941 [Trichonephila clavipes]